MQAMIESSTPRNDSPGNDPGTLVVGLGKTGLSCVRHLRRLGRRVSAVDSRPSPPALEAVSEEFPEVRVTLGGFPWDAFEGVDDIVVSPGVSLAEPVLKRAIAARKSVCGDIELFARAVGATPENSSILAFELVGNLTSPSSAAIRNESAEKLRISFRPTYAPTRL